MRSTVSGNSRFAKQTSSQDGVTALNQICSGNNKIVFVCLGSYNNNGGTRIKHRNGSIARDYTNDYKQPTNLAVNSAVSFGGCTFEENGDGYASVEVYTFS